jgi:galactose-1-phosphate uridylyltransferase
VVLDHDRHVLFPSEIGAEAFANGIRAAAELVRRLRRHDASLVHHVAGMNFLLPAGSSVPHPHFQVQIRGVPYSGVARAIERSAAFKAAKGSSFWDELVEQERALGVRRLGRTGPVEWIAAWAPAHQKEIWGVLPGVSSLVEVGDVEAVALAEGIAKVVSFYEAIGTHPFNFAFFSAPMPVRDGSFALHVRMCSRPALKPLYANYDTWFTPKLVGDDVHTEAPEQYAAQLRTRW